MMIFLINQLLQWTILFFVHMLLSIPIVNIVVLPNEKILSFFFKGTEAQSQLRRPGESELDYYERRYQERVNEHPIGMFFFSFLSFSLATSFSWNSCST